MSRGASDRLLVVGASGLVGGELARRARAAGFDVCGVARSVRGEATRCLDLADRAALERVLDDVRPSIVAICSAYAHVDGCERDPTRSHRENVETVQNLVAATRNTDVGLIFYSSDHVFDGARETYVESDAVAPMSVYARHKRAVEELLLERGHSLVVRTAWVFGTDLRRKNFVYRVIDAAQGGAQLRLPVGQAGCPTFSGWLADATVALLWDAVEGVAHLSGGELLTKAEWMRLVVHTLGLPACEPIEVPWDAAGQVAPRPEKVRLRSERHSLVHPDLRSTLLQLRESLVTPAASKDTDR
jgi:dTDP-4-dehydrorhamnose reductase